ncbi:MAG: baseplate J/gp47 family protein [Eubacteriales bacterium]|jgi:uncharacterized phage protein gp47/JayE
MFEEMTFDKLMEGMLSHVSDTLDKREGSVVYDMLSPMAAELAGHYSQLGAALELLFWETSSGIWLDRLGEQFGIPRRQATNAVYRGVFTDQEDLPAQVETGSRFRWEEYTFAVEDSLGEGKYTLVCEQPGSGANAATGTILPVLNLPSLQSAVLEQLLEEGTDQESDEQYRARAMELLARPAFAGNISAYQEETLSIGGVGCVKVFPVFDGGGTVGLVIGNAQGRAVDEMVLQKVQEHYALEGEQSVTPIGHQVTVKSCVDRTVPVELAVDLVPEADWSSVQSQVQNRVAQWMSQIDFEEERVFVARLMAAVLEVDGVADVPMAQVKLDGKNANLVLQKDMETFETPVCGTVTVRQVS